jgi:hypothetical protein
MQLKPAETPLSSHHGVTSSVPPRSPPLPPSGSRTGMARGPRFKQTPGAKCRCIGARFTKGLLKNDSSEKRELTADPQEAARYKRQGIRLVGSAQNYPSSASYSPSECGQLEHCSREGRGSRRRRQLTHLGGRWHSLEIKPLLAFCLVSQLLFFWLKGDRPGSFLKI